MDDVRRPDPPSPLHDRVRAWIEWLGPARLATSSIAVVVVCVGGWWLVRSPTPTPEAGLPVATAPSAPSSSGASSPSDAGPTTPTTIATTSTVESTSLVVHVTGAVARPGVYTFRPGDRLADAVERAGGAVGDGRPHELNLAAPLVDGLRVVVPIEGEEVPAELRAPVGDPAAGAAGGVTVEPVDVNRATIDELETLPGVGPTTAAAIVTERERNGPFVSVDDLERVPGIGPVRLAAVRELVTT